MQNTMLFSRASLGALLLGTALFASALPAGHTSAATTGGALQLSLDQIPTVPGALPVLRLTPQKAPVDFVDKILPGAAPNTEGLVPLSKIPFYRQHGIQTPPNFLGAFNGNHLAAYVDTQSGDAQVYPTLGNQTPVRADALPAFLKRASVLGRNVFLQYGLLGKDDTTAAIGAAQPLDGTTSTHVAGVPSGKGGAVLAYVPVQRYVGQFRVDGMGSRAVLALDAGGRIQSFVRSWKTGTTFTRVIETRSKQQVAQAIAAQFKPVLQRANVYVTSVSIGYYDGNQSYLQPVYRVTARIHYNPSAAARRQADDDFVVGYVGIGRQFERLPNLAQSGGPQPSVPGQSAPSLSPMARTAKTNFDPSVGRYVVRNDNPNWVADANEFYGGLTSWWGGLFFSNAQYYWAHPFEFTSSKNSYINSVNIALNEVHGDWWYYTTYQNWGDGVDLSSIPYPGYGAAAGGRLDYWIIHSCEVVPSPDDTSHWADPWWNIFGGLHSVVGYRTIMWIDDDVGGPYGFSLMLGAPVVGAWLNTVISDPIYASGGEVMHGVWKRYGRPSTISMSGRENDSAYDTTPLPRAGSLTIYWYPG